MLVKNGQTAVIGGLIDRQQDHTRGGVPFLRDILLLGRVFGSSQGQQDPNGNFPVHQTDEVVDSVKNQIEHNAELLRKQLEKSRLLIAPDSATSRH